MKMKVMFIVAASLFPAAALAGSQSSNTSSNSSSNNGVVRERVVDTYCEDGRCSRVVERRTYRDKAKRGADQRYRAIRYGRDDDESRISRYRGADRRDDGWDDDD